MLLIVWGWEVFVIFEILFEFCIICFNKGYCVFRFGSEGRLMDFNFGVFWGVGFEVFVGVVGGV